MEKSTHAPPLSTLQAAAWWQKQTGRGPTGAAPPFEGCAPRWARAGQTREKFTRHNADRQRAQNGPEPWGSGSFPLPPAWAPGYSHDPARFPLHPDTQRLHGGETAPGAVRLRHSRVPVRSRQAGRPQAQGKRSPPTPSPSPVLV